MALKITAPDQINHILNMLLGKKPCTVLVGTQEHATGFISFNILSTGSELKLRTQLTDAPDERRIVIRNNNKKIVTVMKLMSKTGPSELLIPQYIEIEDEAKSKIETYTGLTGFFLTNLTTYKEIAIVIESNKKKVTGFVINFFDEELNSIAPFHKLFLISGDHSDLRMKQLVKNPRIIYYDPNIPDDRHPRQYFPVSTYKDEIQKVDFKIPAKMRAEVTVPVFYKGKIPVGYIQANSATILGDATIQALKKMAVAIETQLRKLNLPFEEMKPFAIQHLTLKTLELEITERTHLRYFQKDQLLIFRLQKGSDMLGQYSATVESHTNLGGGRSKAVLKFQEMDAMAELNLEEALKT